MPGKADKEAKAAAAAARKAAAAEEAAKRKAEKEARMAAELAAEQAAATMGMGVALEKGNRGAMEDRATAVRLPLADLRFVGVYDGHCGDGCAEFVAQHFPSFVWDLEELHAGHAKQALAKALENAHAAWLKEARPSDESGATATVALHTRGTLYVASLGNCQCVVCGAGGRAQVVTSDNKPEVQHRGLFGPEQPSPELMEVPLAPDGECPFLIVATDGVWDVFKPQKAVDLVRAALSRNAGAPGKAAKALVDAAYEDSSDNIAAAVLLCDFDPPPPNGPAPAPPPKPQPARARAATATATATATGPPRATASARPGAVPVFRLLRHGRRPRRRRQRHGQRPHGDGDGRPSAPIPLYELPPHALRPRRRRQRRRRGPAAGDGGGEARGGSGGGGGQAGGSRSRGGQAGGGDCNRGGQAGGGDGDRGGQAGGGDGRRWPGRRRPRSQRPPPARAAAAPCDRAGRGGASWSISPTASRRAWPSWRTSSASTSRSSARRARRRAAR